MDIKFIINNLRIDVAQFRLDRKNYYISPEICTVEIALNLVEFCLKRNRVILEEEEMWFNANYLLAHGLQGTQWENVYINYVNLTNYVKNNNYFRNSIPKVDWDISIKG